MAEERLKRARRLLVKVGGQPVAGQEGLVFGQLRALAEQAGPQKEGPGAPRRLLQGGGDRRPLMAF
jgi:hypothetical protein